jgi:hypothetical protein
VVFDTHGIGARALRIDGDPKRMRGGLDRAFAGKDFRVNNRQRYPANFHGHGMFHAQNDNINGTIGLKPNVPVDKRG